MLGNSYIILFIANRNCRPRKQWNTSDTVSVYDSWRLSLYKPIYQKKDNTMWRLKACLLIFIFNNRNILSFRHIIEIFCALNYCTFRFSAKYMRYFTYKNVTISKGCNNVTINIQNAHYWNLLDTVWIRILQRERGVL